MNYFTAEETAEQLGVNIATIYRWRKDNKIQVKVVPSKYLVPESELERLKPMINDKGTHRLQVS